MIKLQTMPTMPLKFRVWDRVEGRFLKWGGVIEADMFALSEFMAGQVDEYFYRRYVVSQDTGLVDKNGKHIFTGDIIEREGLKLVVGYENGEVKYYPLFKGRTTVWPSDFTIVGNIFENPELLGEVK